MVVLAKPRKAAPSWLLSWRRVESYMHEAFSVQKRKESATLLRGKQSKRFRILYHEAQSLWIIAVCDDMLEVWNDWCFVLKQPKLQQYPNTFASPKCDDTAIPDPVPPSLVTSHKFVKLQVRERTWCNFCKALIFKISAKECIYCKFVIHEKCEEALDNHPPLKYCQMAQDVSMQTISYEARMCKHGKDKLKALADKETLFEVHPQRRVLLIRTAGLTSIEHKIQTLQVRKSQKNKAKFRLFYKADQDDVDLYKGDKFEMVSAAECENFCSTLELLDPDRPQSVVGPNIEDCSLFVFSWNMGQRAPDNASLKQVLTVTGFDIVVVGVQECDYAPRGNARTAEADWFRTVESMLEGSYVRVAATSLRYIRLQIFVSKPNAHKITKVQELTEGTGIGGVMGNKGAAGVAVYYLQSRICFVASHLAAHQDHLDSRRRDYCDIISGLNFHLGANKHLDILHAFDFLFWFGDLNYRLDMERAEVMRHIQAGNYNRLLQSDQLLREMELKQVFQGFQTSLPTFPPTYKYVQGVFPREYDDTKQRIPSYTDRILWRSHVQDGVKAQGIRCYDTVVTSDHSPVGQSFVIKAQRQFILGDDAFTTRRALRITGLAANNPGLAWCRVKFLSGNLDGKWQTSTSKYGTWGSHQIPLLPCILGVVEFIQAHPLFLVLWDVNTNRSKGQGVVYLSQLTDDLPIAFEVQLLHEGSLAGTLTGQLSLEITCDDDLDQPVPALLLLGDMPRRGDEDDTDSQEWDSEMEPPPMPSAMRAHNVSPSPSSTGPGIRLPLRGLKERPRTEDGRPGFQPRSPTMDDSDSASALGASGREASMEDPPSAGGLTPNGGSGFLNAEDPSESTISPTAMPARMHHRSTRFLASQLLHEHVLSRVPSSTQTPTPSETPTTAPADLGFERYEPPTESEKRHHFPRGQFHRTRSNGNNEHASPGKASDRSEHVYHRLSSALHSKVSNLKS